MFSYPKFDVRLERKVSGAPLRWPGPGEARDDNGLGGNRSYVDLRRLSWSEAQRVFALEEELIGRIVSAEDPEDEYDKIGEELYDDPEGLIDLDLGVASSVVALSAARCVPFSSCSGGAFGGSHNEHHPLVAFMARREAVALLLECAETSDIGLVDANGYLLAYSDDIRGMRRFAASTIDRRVAFRALRFQPTRTSRVSKRAPSEQIEFNFLEMIR